MKRMNGRDRAGGKAETKKQRLKHNQEDEGGTKGAGK